MPDQAGPTASNTASSAPATTAAPAAPASTPTQASSAPPTNQPPAASTAGERPGNTFRSEAEYEASIADEGDTSLATMAEDMGDVLDGIADPLGSADSESDTDATQVGSAKAKDDGEVDFAAMRQGRDVQDAAFSLIEAGIPEATVKALYKSDKAGLLAFAQRLAGGQPPAADAQAKDGQPAKQGQEPAADADPFEAIFDDAKKSWGEFFDEDSVPAIIAPLQKMASTMREMLGAETKRIHSEYADKITALQNNNARVESEFAARELMNDFPQLKDQANYQKVLAKMVENAQNGKRANSMKELMQAAATDLWSRDKEITRRQQAAQSAKDRSIGQPTLKDGRTEAAGGGVREVSYDQWESAIYTARTEASRRGDDPEQAVARVKSRMRIKPGSRM